MLLSLSTGEEIENPSASQIEHALRSLPEERGGFALLTLARHQYMEATGTPEEGFVLEYRAGSRQQHFRTKQATVGLAEVLQAFTAYAQGDARYQSRLAWKRNRFPIHVISLFAGGATMALGTLLHARLVQATAAALITVALGLWTLGDIQSGEMSLRGSIVRREREPFGYWLLIGVRGLATALALWAAIGLGRGTITLP